MRIEPQQSLHNRLVSFWKLEEASGNRLDAYTTVPTADKTAVNDLTPNGAPSNGTGKIGNGIVTVAGSNQTVSKANNSSLQIANGQSFTVSGWVFRTANPITAMRPFSKTDSAGGILEWAVAYVQSTGKMRLNVNDSTGLHQTAVDDTITAALNTWYFVVAWFDNVGNTINISVNNDAPSNAAFSFEVNPGTGPFLIGGTNSVSTFFWTGTIDAVGFWKRVLTAEERTWLYRAGTGVEFPFA